jgi:glucan phosphoethanolaminetransferase (alkaline phosphatase superfamily)
MKKDILLIILDSIFLIVFNAFFFLVGGVDHSAGVWISYYFIHFAYAMLLVTPRLTRRGKSAAVTALPIYSIATVYFVLSLLIGVIVISFAFEDYRISLLTQLSLAALYAVILIANLIANTHTAEAEEKRGREIAYVKSASARLESMVEGIGDKEARKKVERVYDAIKSSPVRSHPDLADVETRILESINELGGAVSAGNKDAIVSMADRLLSSVNERNTRLKNLN